MNKYLKKLVKKILRKLGFELRKLSNSNSTNSNLGPYAKENLLDSFYNLLKTQNFKPSVIYDIGANKGTWTKECLKVFPDAHYHLFEPQENLSKNIYNLLSDYSNFNLYSVGLGDENTSAYFTMHDRDDSCSFSYSKEEALERGFKQVELPIYRLDSFIEENNLLTPDILKIDAEGLDLNVLEGAKGIIQNVEVIMVEVVVLNYRMENTVKNVVNYLDTIGFKFFDITDLNRPFPNKVLWLSEFVFVRKGGFLDKNYR